MIVGVGVDLLRLDRMARELLHDTSAFVRKTYTERERAEATASTDPATYLISRFCAKEAVFKALTADPATTRLNDIEVLRGECGQPLVTLHGDLLRHAQRLGIIRIHASLTYETEHVLCFAIAES